MGITLLAVLTAALLLPGIVAVRAFFASAKTVEVEPAVPSLSSVDGIALVGGASLAIHTAYAFGLLLVSQLPPLIPLPLANPYALFDGRGGSLRDPGEGFGLFSGLLLLCLAAHLCGRFTGQRAHRIAGDKFLYGPLAEVIRKGDGHDRAIVAYVLGKLGDDGRQVGYQGTVIDVVRDGDRFPTKVILRNASMFYLMLRPGGPERREMPGMIDTIALSSADWHNIAFRVFRYEE